MMSSQPASLGGARLTTARGGEGRPAHLRGALPPWPHGSALPTSMLRYAQPVSMLPARSSGRMLADISRGLATGAVGYDRESGVRAGTYDALRPPVLVPAALHADRK